MTTTKSAATRTDEATHDRLATLIARVAQDFLEPTEAGFRLRPEGTRAVQVAAELVTRLGALAPALDELLRLSVRLERGRSLDAAQQLEAAISEVASVRQLLGVRTSGALVPHLRRRRLKLLNEPRSQAQFQIRDLLTNPPGRVRRLA